MSKLQINCRVASDRVAMRGLQLGCFVAAAVVPLLAFRKFAVLELSEPELLVGVLAAMAMALFYSVLGVLLEFKLKS